MNVLYLSYDGMTDPLGQSQVLPYLRGLTRLGHQFTLISFEKPERYSKYRELIAGLMRDAGIDWRPLMYTKRPPVLSTLFDKFKMQQLAFELHVEKKFDVVHCRSYISALVGEQLKQKAGLKFVFDMRGFWADERVDGGLWNLSNPLYRSIYHYFKKKEKDFLLGADHIISLTHAAQKQIQSRNLRPQPLPITVIPCCADLDLFSAERITDIQKQQLRKQLGIAENAFVLSYLGSIGTWYLPGEMMDFFKCLCERRPDACFLFITTEPREYLTKLAAERGIAADKIITIQTTHAQVPAYLSLSNWSIFFIKPVFSKMASSATKQGEIMGMGIPHICNEGVGDIADILKGGEVGITIQEFSNAAYNRAIDEVIRKTFDKNAIIAKAAEVYSLQKGVAQYASVYKMLSNR